MTKQAFLNLETNKKSVEILIKESARLAKVHGTIGAGIFFNEVAVQIREYIYMPKATKAIVKKPTTSSILAKYEEIKAMGYRKELSINFE